MPAETKTIYLTSKLGISVNCFLVKARGGYVLIDTGLSSLRGALEKELEKEECLPGNLSLIVLTHGDSDHASNCAYLREKYGAKILMHCGDLGMVERGDMFWNRKKGNSVIRMIVRFFGLGKSDRFRPDSFIEDGYDLSGYGFDATVLHVPGHSKGSIAILTADGDLFCGDLLTNRGTPALGSIIDDMTETNASIEKLKGLKIRTVYPGHGKPFPMERVIKRQ